jgi:poly(3-hydroxybutyrate) depolymerase|tara:strand:- start:10 stop:417 length:408 start_codon:yes stop_codon:yes gene_type:complete
MPSHWLSKDKEVRLLMRRKKFLPALVLLVLSNACEEEDASDKSTTFSHNGMERDSILYKPYKLDQNAPLFFVLHGHTGSVETIQWHSGMNNMVDANGFAVCYPQGTSDYGGTTYWNTRLSISQTDDIETTANEVI